MKVRSRFFAVPVAVLVSVTVLLPDGAALAAAIEGERNASPFGHQIDVTAVTTTMVALDKKGRAVLDLQPGEVRVFEDGQEVNLLALERGLAPDENHTTSVPSVEETAVSQPWRVVVYVSTELAGRFVLPAVCRRAAAEVERLTALGPVDLVLADPSPLVVAEASSSPDEVRRELQILAAEASGVTKVERIRNAFIRDFKPGVGFDVNYTITQASPAAMAARARAAVNRERTVIRGELDRMVAWMQSEPPATRGMLVWLAGGFDINPADFYLPLLEQIDPFHAQTLRTVHHTLSLEPDVRRMVEVAIAYGWTVMPVNSSQARFLYGAEVAGTGKVQHHQGVGAESIDTQGGEFRQVAPTYPLRVIAHGTGGEFVANDDQYARALDHARSAYTLVYQVDRPADGRLHRLEVRCTRPGVRVRSRSYAAAGTLRGVATTRAHRLLDGEEVRGALVLSADVHNITRAEKGQRIGDLEVRAEVSELAAVLAPVNLGQMRVSVVVEIEDRAPFVHHQEIEPDWDSAVDGWHFTLTLKWPKKARRLAVVVEELVTSTWGAATLDLQ